MNTAPTLYPIGTPGKPWGNLEREEWLSQQTKQRSYETEVLTVIDHLRTHFDVEQYGSLSYGSDSYPLFAIRNRDWNDDLPIVLVTGGGHGRLNFISPRHTLTSYYEIFCTAMWSLPALPYQ